MQEWLKESYNETGKVLSNFYTQNENYEKIGKIIQMVARAFQNGQKVLVAGNGGSACDAFHFAEDLTGRFRKERKALPVLALGEPTFLTAVANDYGFDRIFARSIEAYGRKGDLFIGITTSGNSPNIIEAMKVSKDLELSTIGILGRDGGKLKSKCDIEIIVNGNTSDKIQEIHMIILHQIIEGVERILFPGNY